MGNEGVRLAVLAIAIALLLQGLTILLDFGIVKPWDTYLKIFTFLFCVIAASFLILRVLKSDKKKGLN